MASIPAKKRKSRGGETRTLEDVKTLGHQLLFSRSHVNNLPILVSIVSPSSPLELALESLISLQSFFVPLIPEIPPSSVKFAAPDEKDPDSVYRAWLRSNFDEFVGSLIGVAISPQSTEVLRDVALDAIMDFVKLGKGGRFQSAIYHKFLQSIVRATSYADPLLDLLVPKYFKYIDVRYFTYTSIDKIVKTYESTKGTDAQKVSSHEEGEASDSSYFTYTSIDKIVKTYESTKGTDAQKVSSHEEGEASDSRMELDIHIIYNILSRVPHLVSADKETGYEMWSQLGLSSKKEGKLFSDALVADSKPQILKYLNSDVSTAHISKKLKLKFTKAWISFLKFPLPLDVYKEVLGNLYRDVIPYIANPAILCDFLTRSYDIGGVISVMALSGLFILMTQHGLEYPRFYEKLYALLTPAVFVAKHRAVFFQLLDACLKSSYLPAYLAAAFAKKLSRLSLSVPPSGALVIIAIIHNLLRRHPSINFLIQQLVDDETDGANEAIEGARESDGVPFMDSKKQCVDTFNNEEMDPAKSGAMRSSLWEIDTLRHHYCPAVSRFVASLESDLTVRAKTQEVLVADFSSGSYSTIFREEIRRRIKQVPLAFYKVTPTSLFWESDFAGWTFSTAHEETILEENGITNTVENDDHEAKRQRI